MHAGTHAHAHAHAHTLLHTGPPACTHSLACTGPHAYILTLPHASGCAVSCELWYVFFLFCFFPFLFSDFNGSCPHARPRRRTHSCTPACLHTHTRLPAHARTPIRQSVVVMLMLVRFLFFWFDFNGSCPHASTCSHTHSCTPACLHARTHSRTHTPARPRTHTPACLHAHTSGRAVSAGTTSLFFFDINGSCPHASTCSRPHSPIYTCLPARTHAHVHTHVQHPRAHTPRLLAGITGGTSHGCPPTWILVGTCASRGKSLWVPCDVPRPVREDANNYYCGILSINSDNNMVLI